MLRKILLITLLFAIALLGCKTKKRVTSKPKKPRVVHVDTPKPSPTPSNSEPEPVTELPANTPYNEVVSHYINTYSDIAKEEMLQYGIPASITLAQGILESGAGRGDLTRRANNHFGIKCHRGWTGERVYHDDDELQECFRKYKHAKYSFRDHSLFLTQRSRYQDLFKLRKDDYKGWAKGLRKAGYATDPRYPDKLISIIERYQLQRYDNEVLGGEANPAKTDDMAIRTHTVSRGDTLYNIARRYNLTVETLKEYNGLTDTTIKIGQVLYLHSVKNR